MKKNILIFFIGFICATIIGVGANILYKAEDISYNSAATGVTASNVQDALDEITGDAVLLKNISSTFINKETGIANTKLTKIENVDSYKFYVITIIYWTCTSRTNAYVEDRTEIKNVSNARLVSVGLGSGSGGSAGATRSYILIPDSSGKDIDIEFDTNGVDAYSIYGIK